MPKKVKLNERTSLKFTSFKYGEVVDMYSLEEIRNFKNISEVEISDCEEEADTEIGEYHVVGFVKDKFFTEEEPSFIQVFNDEVEELNNGN